MGPKPALAIWGTRHSETAKQLTTPSKVWKKSSVRKSPVSPGVWSLHKLVVALAGGGGGGGGRAAAVEGHTPYVTVRDALVSLRTALSSASTLIGWFCNSSPPGKRPAAVQCNQNRWTNGYICGTMQQNHRPACPLAEKWGGKWGAIQGGDIRSIPFGGGW